MRVLVIGRSKPGHAERAMWSALRRAGHTAALVDDVRMRQRLGRRLADAWLRARVSAFRPERVILGKALGFSVGALAEVARRAPLVMYYQDVRIPPDPAIVERARLAEVVFLVAGGQAAEYEAAGIRRALFLPAAAATDWDRAEPPDPTFTSDVAFIGTGYDEYRAAFLTRLARRFDIRVWGPGWERWAKELNWTGRTVHGRDFARVCASAKVLLGINPSFHRAEPVWGCASNRMWKTLACGGFYLGHATPGMRELLRDGEHCAWYDDEDGAAAAIERYLADDAARERIRREGRAFVLAHHTFDSRVSNLLTGRPFENPLMPGGVER